MVSFITGFSALAPPTTLGGDGIKSWGEGRAGQRPARGTGCSAAGGLIQGEGPAWSRLGRLEVAGPSLLACRKEGPRQRAAAHGQLPVSLTRPLGTLIASLGGWDRGDAGWGQAGRATRPTLEGQHVQRLLPFFFHAAHAAANVCTKKKMSELE